MKKLLTFTAVALIAASSYAVAGHHMEKKDGGKHFERHDTNGDGVISKEEFLAQGTERFTKMDADGNGEVTKEEAKAAHDAMKEKMKENRGKKGQRDAAEDGVSDDGAAE